MRYVAAYLLAVLGGNKNPSLSDLEKILGSVGIEVDNERAKKVISELNGKDVNDVIDAGRGKLASMPAGGSVVAAGPATGGTAEAPSSPAKDAGKEEKKEESEESDDDMGFGLFD